MVRVCPTEPGLRMEGTMTGSASWQAELDPAVRCQAAGLSPQEIDSLTTLGIDLHWAADLAMAGADVLSIRGIARRAMLSRPSRDHGLGGSRY